MRAFLILPQNTLLANESHKSQLLLLELLSLMLLELLLLSLLLELLLSLLSLLELELLPSLEELLLLELLLSSSDDELDYEDIVFSTCFTTSSFDLP